MTDETIFRLFSMTKPITSVVAMMLIEEGKFKLDDPIAKYIPSFAKVKVGVEKKAEDGTRTLELVPPNQLPTMLRSDAPDLGYHLRILRRQPGPQGLCRRRHLCGRFRQSPSSSSGSQNCRCKISRATLWQYGHSTDILGRIMEIVTGKSLLAIEREKLLDPLGMNDTRFYVTDPEKKKLIARPMPNDSDFRVGFESKPDRSDEVGIRRRRHGLDHEGLRPLLADDPQWRQVRGQAYLSPKTFEMMTTDQVGPGSGVDRDYLLFPRRRLRLRARLCRAHRSRQRQAAAAGLVSAN